MKPHIDAQKQTLNDFNRLVLTIAIALIPVLIFIYFAADKIIPAKHLNFQNLIKNLSVALLPICALFAASYLYLRKTQVLKQSLDTAEILDGIEEVLYKEKLTREVVEVSYSYHSTDWNVFLKDATSFDLCLFYASNDWMNKNIPIFEKFLANGGHMNVWLPNPLEITGKFVGLSKLSLSTGKKIAQTYCKFSEELKGKFPNNIFITFADSGFSYMFARAKTPQMDKILISPYSNNSERVDSPAVIFDSKRAPEDLSRFVGKELASYKKSNLAENLQDKELIVWDKTEKKVFISSDLYCSMKCKFCFVESIKNEHLRQTEDAAQIFTLIVTNDRRYQPGPGGTNIMLGGFTDPFLASNFEFTLEFLRLLHPFKNMVHIATRVPLKPEQVKKLEPYKSNIFINISISTYNNITPAVEPKNQKQRFEFSKILVDAGFDVSLFVRPVIPKVTLEDTPKIIDEAKRAGVKFATIGGLYVDGGIKQRLKKNAIALSRKSLPGIHVLDTDNKLKKVKNDDLEKVRKSFSEAGFTVFQNADARIEHYKSQLTKST